MARDVAGISRVNMFEKVVDPTSGTTYTPVSRIGTKVVYQASDGRRVEAPDYRMGAAELAYYVQPSEDSPPYPGAVRAVKHSMPGKPLTRKR